MKHAGLFTVVVLLLSSIHHPPQSEDAPLKAPKPAATAAATRSTGCDHCPCATDVQLLRTQIQQLQNDVDVLRSQIESQQAKPAEPATVDVTHQVLLFTSDRCDPCRRDKTSVLEPLKNAGLTVGVENSNDVVLVDADALPEHLQAWKVTGLPTYILIEDNGQEVVEIRRREGRLYSAQAFREVFAELKPKR